MALVQPNSSKVFSNQSIIKWLPSSDECKPSWLEPQLKLKVFQLGSSWLVTFSFQLDLSFIHFHCIFKRLGTLVILCLVVNTSQNN